MFPSNRILLTAVLLIGATAFVIRLVFPVGWSVLGMQFGYFASYIVLFAASIRAYRRRWLERLSRKQTKLWLRIALFAIVALPIFMIMT